MPRDYLRSATPLCARALPTPPALFAERGSNRTPHRLRIALPTAPTFLKGLTETMISPTYVYTISFLNRSCAACAQRARGGARWRSVALGGT